MVPKEEVANTERGQQMDEPMGNDENFEGAVGEAPSAASAESGSGV